MELSIWFSPKGMLLSIRFSPILKYLVINTLHNIHSDACLHSLLPQLNNIDPENIRIRRTVSRKIACIVGMYTSDPSGQFYSLQYESSTYLGGW